LQDGSLARCGAQVPDSRGWVAIDGELADHRFRGPHWRSRIIDREDDDGGFRHKLGHGCGDDASARADFEFGQQRRRQIRQWKYNCRLTQPRRLLQREQCGLPGHEEAAGFVARAGKARSAGENAKPGTMLLWLRAKPQHFP